MWKMETRRRKEGNRRIMISALEKGCTREKALDMLRTELTGGVKEEKLSEQKGNDDWLRWFYECDNEEMRDGILERGEKMKGIWRLKISEDRTYRERKKRQILDRKADLERAKNHRAKITIEGDWICVDGTWTVWLDKEAKWCSERDWDKREKEKEKKRLEAKLAILKRELSGEEIRESTPASRVRESHADGTEETERGARTKDEEEGIPKEVNRAIAGSRPTAGEEERDRAETDTAEDQRQVPA